jgi:hypothetical protein
MAHVASGQRLTAEWQNCATRAIESAGERFKRKPTPNQVQSTDEQIRNEIQGVGCWGATP